MKKRIVKYVSSCFCAAIITAVQPVSALESNSLTSESETITETAEESETEPEAFLPGALKRLFRKAVGLPEDLSSDSDGRDTAEFEEETAMSSDILREDESEEETISYLEELDQQILEQLPDNNEKEIYSILFAGSDRRDTTWNGNSDSVILVTINDYTETVYITSFMRDMGVQVPGYGLRKLNDSYAIGGGDLLIRTMEENFDLTIDHYAGADFFSMADIVDEFGGVDLYVSAAERDVLNMYLDELCDLNGFDTADYYVPLEDGEIHMNGQQTVAFCRIRYVGRNDYERTERQRRVLTQLMDKAKDMSILELVDIADDAISCLLHDYRSADTLELIFKVIRACGYEVVTDRVPYDDLHTMDEQYLNPDFPQTIIRLQESVFSTEEKAEETSESEFLGSETDTEEMTETVQD